MTDRESLLSILLDDRPETWPAEVVDDGGDGTVFDCSPVPAEWRYCGGPFDGFEVVGHLPAFAVEEEITEDVRGLDGLWRYHCPRVMSRGDGAVAVMIGAEATR